MILPVIVRPEAEGDAEEAFGVFFAVEASRVAVLAIMHLARNPQRWEGRGERNS
jgi:hypothetical protein